MYRIAIVEDDPLFIVQLKDYIQKYRAESGEAFQIICFSDGESILDQYTPSYDLILMDIQMKLINGLDAAKEIRKTDKKVVIVFVTNSIQHAMHGYSVSALDYIVKPVNYFKFSQMLKRAIEVISEERDEKFMMLRTNTGVIIRMMLRQIYYIESRHHYLVYVTKQGEYIVRGILSDCGNALTPYGFFRVQKSFVINMKMVEQVKADSCVINGTEIAISRAKKREFMQEILKYMDNVHE